ncbi:hypothetical protein AX14_002828 [Amanita brunnescens Koide BX004]|nr:hypothetical protein AX14_002828 [Amanita brunnescens Koide BX004]
MVQQSGSMNPNLQGGSSNPDSDVIILVMGFTGCGKSTFINLATQSERKLAVGHSIQSCTASVDQADPFYLNGRRVIMYDTPGSNDTYKDEHEILRIVALELEKQYRPGTTKKQLVHGVIYIHRISENRVGNLAISNFKTFRKICGEDSLKNVVIVTTMWDKVTKEEGERRVQDLISLDDFFKPALAKKAQLVHHTPNTVDSAHNIINLIIQNNPLPLDIQKELVDQGKDITQTSAGKELDKQVAKLTAMYEEKLRKQKQEMDEARKQRDAETEQEMKELSEKVQAKVDKLNRDRENQAAEYKKLQAQLLQAEEDRKREAKVAQDRLNALDEQRKRDAITAQRQLESAKAEWLRNAQPIWQASTSGFQPGTYFVFNYRSGRVLDLAGYDNWSMLCFPFHGGPNQQWIFTSYGQDTFSIRDVRSGRYVSSYGQDNTRLAGSNSPYGWLVRRDSSTGCYIISVPGTNLVFDHADYGRSEFVSISPIL